MFFLILLHGEAWEVRLTKLRAIFGPAEQSAIKTARSAAMASHPREHSRHNVVRIA